MPEKLKELLEKINTEGVQQAEEQARVIESKAKDERGKILKDAELEAQRIVEEAEADAKKTKETMEIFWELLKQACCHIRQI